MEPEYKSIRPKGARDESPEERGEYLRDGAEVPLKPLSSETMKYIQAPPEKDHNVHYHDTRHYSYAGPPSHVAGNGQWEYVQPAELSRHMSYSRPEQLQDHGVASQSSYQREYEEEMERKRQERARQEQGGWGQEQARGMSFETPGAFPSDDRSANAAQNPMSPSAMQHPPGEYPQMTRQENYQPQTHQANYHPQTHQAEYHPQDSTRQTEYRQPSHGFYQPHSPDETSQPIIMSVAGSRPQYYVPQKFQYAEAPKEIKYVSKPQTEKSQYRMPPQAQIEVGRKRTGHAEPEHRVEYRGEQRGERIEERRGDRGEHRKDHQGHREHREEYRAEKTSSRGHRGETKYIEIHPRDSTLNAPPSPGLAPRVQRLSISGGRSGGQSGALTLSAPDIHHNPSGTGALPPGSPLQEAYQGTWQSISPMPSPMALPSALDDGLSDLEPLSPEFDTDDSQHRRPRKSILKKRVSIYDPEPDARAIAAELKHAKPGAEALIHILPQLSDDNMLALRTEYKKHFKVGGKGINVAKHVKTKLPGNIGKVAYATALGRWESEAYWANCWYQSGSSRRELLIESLMGRPNREVRAIKEAFRDKRYGDSLERCMQTELKRDKFRMAILLALDERRGDEMAPVSKTRVREDVQDLYRALVAKEGGETAMIEIVVVRSDNHLREVLKEFEARYRRNFAREMIQKSQNLVVRACFLSCILSALFRLASCRLCSRLVSTAYRL